MLKALRDKMVSELLHIYPKNESLQIVSWLFESVGGIKTIDIVNDPGRILGDELTGILQRKHVELLKNKPLQYVTGHAFFYGTELEVNSSVLIPRPETEELVKWVIDDNRLRKGLKILDIGTGSGCIIIAAGLHLANPVLTGTDISEEALKTASKNASRAGVKVDFIKMDILSEMEWPGSDHFDLIISNPPYVREMEKAAMRPNVLDYEPAIALFVPDDNPLIFYRAMAKFARLKLNMNGMLYLEINENLAEETISLLRKEGFGQVELRKDFHGKNRMIRGSRPVVSSAK